MNPQSAGRTPNQANTYREQYIASLMLDISNMAKTLNASRGIVTTGESGAPPVDGRTITEKYADIDSLKVMLRGQLKEITDGQNAQDIVYELTTNELEFLAGQIPFVIADLKPKWRLGIPAEAFIPYLRKLMRKSIETQGVEYGLQEGGGVGLPPPGVNNIMPVEAFQQFMYDLDDILAIPEEGELQSVGSFGPSLAPSEASSRYSQPRIDFGTQFGAPRPPRNIRPSILKMRDMIHRDMMRIIDAYPSREDEELIANFPDPFLVENWQATVASFADTLPNLQQMRQYGNELEQAIRDDNQGEAEDIIREWSAIVSNVDYNQMEDAKALIREARLQQFEELEEPLPDPTALDEDDLSSYFSKIQSAPTTVTSFTGRSPEIQSFTGTEENLSAMTEMPELPEDVIPIISYQDFTRLPLRQKRDYLTTIGEVIPNGALEEFFDELVEGAGSIFEEDILDRIDKVYPTDEGAEGGNSEDCNAIYGAMLQSQVLGMNVGDILLDEPDEIASLPASLVLAVSPEKMAPIEPLISREEFAQRSAEKAGNPEITPQGVAELELTPQYRFSGNGLYGMCSGRGCGNICCRDSKKMKAGKLPSGKKRNIIMGRGLLVPKVTSKVVPNNIDLSLGVKAEPAYISFGKHLINKHRLLKDDVLMLRTMKGGAIMNIPTQKISKGLSKVLKTIIGGGNPDFESLNVLTDGDKEVLYNISKTSRLSHSVPNPNKTSQEQEDTRFEILRGQIASGQDNKEAIKEFKLLLIKMMNQKRIPKGQGIDILTEMAAMGL